MQLLYLDHKSCLSVRWYGIMYRNTVVKTHHTSQRYKSGNVKKNKESFDTVWIIGEWLYNFFKRLYKFINLLNDDFRIKYLKFYSFALVFSPPPWKKDLARKHVLWTRLWYCVIIARCPCTVTFAWIFCLQAKWLLSSKRSYRRWLQNVWCSVLCTLGE